MSRREALYRSGGALATTASGVLLLRENEAAAQQVEAANERAKAREDDVATIDGLIAAVYASISGPAGTRDWDRLRSLFHGSARLIPCVPAQAEQAKEKGSIATRVFTVEEFIKAIEPRVKVEGFFEQEIARRVDRFGSVAHVFSTYESRHALDDAKPFARGINSMQLFFDGKRWAMVTIFWDSERPGQEIPAEYLPKK
jgi:hypothetical protein